MGKLILDDFIQFISHYKDMRYHIARSSRKRNGL
jgi:hypothetical protein